MNAEGTYSKYFNMGSVRKCFKDNSMGTFRPHFDVAGPITLDNDMVLRPDGMTGLAQIRVLFFSMNGNLLFVQNFTETNAQFQIPRNLWNTPFIISVEYNGRILTTRCR